MFDAHTAKQLGLIHQVTGNLDCALDNMLQTLIDNGPVAVKAAKALINDVANKEITATVVKPICFALRITRHAISPRLAISIFCNRCVFIINPTVAKRVSVYQKKQLALLDLLQIREFLQYVLR